MPEDSPEDGGGDTGGGTGDGWADRLARRSRKLAILLEESEGEWRSDRALFATDVPASVVQANRVFQSLLDHVSDVAAEHSMAWREDVVTVLLPVEQRGEENVRVPTGDGETAVVPVTTTSGGVAWTKESLSLADMDRWRDRTFTTQTQATGRSRGVTSEAEEVFLPPEAIRTGVEQLGQVLSEIEGRMDIELDLPEDVSRAFFAVDT